MDVTTVGRHRVLNVTAAASPPAGVGRTAPTSVAANSPSDGGWPTDVGTTSSSDRHKTVSSAGSGVASDSSSVDDSVLGSIGSSFIVCAARPTRSYAVRPHSRNAERNAEFRCPDGTHHGGPGFGTRAARNGLENPPC